MITSVINSPRHNGHKPLRDAAYRRFIRCQNCVGCGCVGSWHHPVDCAHTGPHGLGQQSDDSDSIPLCHWRCHPEYDRDPGAFVSRRGLDLPALRQMFRFLWAEHNQRREK